jgi:hypothetical protein
MLQQSLQQLLHAIDESVTESDDNAMQQDYHTSLELLARAENENDELKAHLQSLEKECRNCQKWLQEVESLSVRITGTCARMLRMAYLL